MLEKFGVTMKILLLIFRLKKKMESLNFLYIRAQVVGWPPIRSFRKNSLASLSKNADEVDGKPGPGVLYVKVSMDGAPYLRKVDLKHCSAYQELSSALEKMFSCFTIGELLPLFNFIQFTCVCVFCM